MQNQNLNESISGSEAIFQAPPGLRILFLVQQGESLGLEGVLLVGVFEKDRVTLSPLESNIPALSPEKLFDVGALICRQAMESTRLQAMVGLHGLSNQYPK